MTFLLPLLGDIQAALIGEIQVTFIGGTFKLSLLGAFSLPLLRDVRIDLTGEHPGCYYWGKFKWSIFKGHSDCPYIVSGTFKLMLFKFLLCKDFPHYCQTVTTVLFIYTLLCQFTLCQ